MSRKAGVRVREGDKKQKQFAKANTECAKKYATALAAGSTTKPQANYPLCRDFHNRQQQQRDPAMPTTPTRLIAYGLCG